MSKIPIQRNITICNECRKEIDVEGGEKHINFPDNHCERQSSINYGDEELFEVDTSFDFCSLDCFVTHLEESLKIIKRK